MLVSPLFLDSNSGSFTFGFNFPFSFYYRFDKNSYLCIA